MTTQLERALQTEVLYRLNRYPVVALSVPNGIWLPAHDEAEKDIVKRLIARMKTDGMLTPGAPDLVVMGSRRSVCVELKRPASRDLFGRKARGRLSPDQKAFRQRCIDHDIEYIVASDWEDIRAVLPELY
jgi:hypothetical protein